jgi:hypothetical protein
MLLGVRTSRAEVVVVNILNRAVKRECIQNAIAHESNQAAMTPDFSIAAPNALTDAIKLF